MNDNGLASKPNTPSILSAPRNVGKNASLIAILILVGLLALSVILNVYAFSSSAQKSSEIDALKRENAAAREEINELKELFHANN